MGFQRDYGLKTDGFSRPGGETEARLNDLISPLIKRASTTTAQTQTAAPSLNEPQTQIAKVEPSQTSHPMQLAQAQGSPSGNTGAVNHGNTMQGTGVNQRQSPSASSSYSSLFQQYRGNLGPREGGIANRPKTADPGGLTNKGMSQKELDRLRQIPRWSNLPARSAQLTDTQIDAIFHEEYFKRPQIEKLANVPGLSAAAPKLAEQVFDAGVQHGILDAGRWLQESIDEVTGTDLRVTDKKGNKLYDGIVGSGTRRALETAVANGKAKEINNRIVQKRVPYMKSRPEFGSNPGWILRAKSFEMP
jgi:lysozyme family protein